MNLVLLNPDELIHGIPPDDVRIRHVREVLGFVQGQPFDAAVVDGPIGKARLLPADGLGTVPIKFDESAPCPRPEPGWLVCGLCRPQTMRRVIRDCATLGVGHMRFVQTDRGEPSYARASLWTDGEVGKLLREAAQQAFNPRLPTLDLRPSLASALSDLPADPSSCRIALDNYEADGRLCSGLEECLHPILAVGSERGWSDAERRLLRSSGFLMRSLGPRVLRTETAAVAGWSLLAAEVWRNTTHNSQKLSEIRY